MIMSEQERVTMPRNSRLDRLGMHFLARYVRQKPGTITRHTGDGLQDIFRNRNIDKNRSWPTRRDVDEDRSAARIIWIGQNLVEP